MADVHSGERFFFALAGSQFHSHAPRKACSGNRDWTLDPAIDSSYCTTNAYSLKGKFYKYSIEIFIIIRSNKSVLISQLFVDKIKSILMYRGPVLKVWGIEKLHHFLKQAERFYLE